MTQAGNSAPSALLSAHKHAAVVGKSPDLHTSPTEGLKFVNGAVVFLPAFWSQWHGTCYYLDSSLPDQTRNGSRKDNRMLVLNRKESERIAIGNDIVITVSRIYGNRVQLAISAPQDVRVLRGELSPFNAIMPSWGSPFASTAAAISIAGVERPSGTSAVPIQPRNFFGSRSAITSRAGRSATWQF